MSNYSAISWPEQDIRFWTSLDLNIACLAERQQITNWIVFGLTWHCLQPRIYNTRGEHAYPLHHRWTHDLQHSRRARLAITPPMNPRSTTLEASTLTHYTTDEPTIYNTRGGHAYPLHHRWTHDLQHSRRARLPITPPMNPLSTTLQASTLTHYTTDEPTIYNIRGEHAYPLHHRWTHDLQHSRGARLPITPPMNPRSTTLEASTLTHYTTDEPTIYNTRGEHAYPLHHRWTHDLQHARRARLPITPPMNPRSTTLEGSTLTHYTTDEPTIYNIRGKHAYPLRHRWTHYLQHSRRIRLPITPPMNPRSTKREGSTLTHYTTDEPTIYNTRGEHAYPLHHRWTHDLQHSRRARLPITLPMNPRSTTLEASTLTHYTTDEPTNYNTRGEHACPLHYRWTHDLQHSRRARLPITPSMNLRSTTLEGSTLTHYTTDEPTIYNIRREHAFPLHHRWTHDLQHSRGARLPITPPMNSRSTTLEASTLTHYTTDEPTIYNTRGEHAYPLHHRWTHDLQHSMGARLPITPPMNPRSTTLEASTLTHYTTDEPTIYNTRGEHAYPLHHRWTHDLQHSRRARLPITPPMNPRSTTLEGSTLTHYTTDEPTIYNTRGEHAYPLHHRWTHDLQHSMGARLPITPPMNPRSTTLEASTLTHYTTDEPTIYNTRGEHAYPLHHRWTHYLQHSRRARLPITPPMNPRSTTFEGSTLTHYTTDEPTIYNTRGEHAYPLHHRWTHDLQHSRRARLPITPPMNPRSTTLEGSTLTHYTTDEPTIYNTRGEHAYPLHHRWTHDLQHSRGARLHITPPMNPRSTTLEGSTLTHYATDEPTIYNTRGEYAYPLHHRWTHDLQNARGARLPITPPMNPRSTTLEGSTLTHYTTDEPTIYNTRGENAYPLHHRWTHDLQHSRRARLPITPPMNPRSTTLEASTLTHYTTDEPTNYNTRGEHACPLNYRWTHDLQHSRRARLPITPSMNLRSTTLEGSTLTHYTTDEPTVYNIRREHAFPLHHRWTHDLQHSRGARLPITPPMNSRSTTLEASTLTHYTTDEPTIYNTRGEHAYPLHHRWTHDLQHSMGARLPITPPMNPRSTTLESSTLTHYTTDEPTI